MPVSNKFVGAGTGETGDVERRGGVFKHREMPDVDIRRLAIACLRELASAAPAVFADFEITALPDGTEVATSPLATDV